MSLYQKLALCDIYAAFYRTTFSDSSRKLTFSQVAPVQERLCCQDTSRRSPPVTATSLLRVSTCRRGDARGRKGGSPAGQSDVSAVRGGIKAAFAPLRQHSVSSLVLVFFFFSLTAVFVTFPFCRDTSGVIQDLLQPVHLKASSVSVQTICFFSDGN